MPTTRLSLGPESVLPEEISLGETAAIEQIRGQLASTSQAQHVLRRNFRTTVEPEPTAGISPGAGQARERTLGPFSDRNGQISFLDVIRTTALPLIALQRAGASSPFLLFEAAAFSGTISNIALSASSVWCSAFDFSNNCPSPSFFGIQLASGSLSFSSPITVTGTPSTTSPLTVPTNLRVTLTLKLIPSSAGTLIDGASSQTPLEATFILSSTGSRLTSCGPASISAFQTTVNLSYANSPAQYDSLFSRLVFPLTASTTHFGVARSSSNLLVFAGTATIGQAGWSIPISTDPPAVLGAAGGVGGLSLNLQAGLSMKALKDSTPTNCGPCTVIVQSTSLMVQGSGAPSAVKLQTFQLFENSSLSLRNAGPFTFRYIDESDGTETWARTATFATNLDRPRDVNGNHSRLSGTGVIVFTGSGGTTYVVLTALTINKPDQTQSFALKNILFRTTTATTASIGGTFVDNVITQGSAVIIYKVINGVPFLPDPYATSFNVPSPVSVADSTSRITLTLTWVPATPVKVDVALSLPTAAAANALKLDAQAQSELLPKPDELSLPTAAVTRYARFLDLSTSVSQFGVYLANVTNTSLSVADQYLQAPNANVAIFATPVVQWEPVINSTSQSSFPSPLTFQNSGQPFSMATKSVTLVPVAPRQSLDGILNSYNSTNSQAVAAAFTLPFGLEAETNLERSPLISLPSPRIQQVQPSFKKSGLQGGDQISIIPAGRPILFPPNLRPTISPSLPGTTTQLANAYYQGQSTASTVMDPLTTAFNQRFSTGGSSQSVPVTRIDISGFGESTFSDWRNPGGDAATISKVTFNVMLGRTSREIVQMFTVKYPFATRVVKTITIERQNTGVVTRTESSWQSVSEGLYQYPKAGITTHRGAVLGIHKITNIRDTGTIHTTPDGSQLEAVFFDCRVQMENVVKGAGSDGLVPVQDFIGYVQISDRTAQPPLGQLDPSQYAELISKVGPMCGRIDCVINVGNSGLLKKVKRIRVASSASDTGSIEFVMESGGAPTLSGGLWSFVFLQGSTTSPQNVDPIDGVPLVRQNATTTTTPPTVYPYIFQRGDDLLPSTASSFICLMHSTGTQRVIFPQIKLEASLPYQLTSKIPPILADPHALASASGPFPQLNLCIPFPSNNYSLVIGTNGDLRLQLPQPSFTTNIGRRVLRSSKTLETRAYCNDENGNPSLITFAIDTTSPTSWSFTMTNTMITTACGSKGESLKVVGDITANSQSPTQLVNSRVVFGDALKPVQAVVSFLEHFGPIPGPTVSMTNDWELDVSMKCDFKQYLQVQLPGLKEAIELVIADLDFKYTWQFSAEGVTNDALYEVTIKIPTGIGPLVAIALASFEIHLADGGPDVYKLTLGGGIGVSFPIFAFKALAYWAVTQSIYWGSDVFGLGSGTLIKGSVDLEVVEVDIQAEASMAVIRYLETIWGVAQVTVAVDVSIFWVLDIEFGWTHEWKNNFNGGPDELPGG